MATVTKTFYFLTSFEGWSSTNMTLVLGDAGYSQGGAIRLRAMGRNMTEIGSMTWTGTYESLGIPNNATITGIDFSLYAKQELTGVADSDSYYAFSHNGVVITSSYNMTTAQPWHIRGPFSRVISASGSDSFTLSLDANSSTGNDKTAVYDLFWDQISLVISYTTPFTDPTVSTSAATGITSTEATLNGNLSDLGTATPADVFFEWREVGAGTWNATTKQTRSTTGTFSQLISGLASNTNHEFRAVIEYQNNGLQTLYGSTLSFQTELAYYTLSISANGNGSVELAGTPITLPYSESLVTGTKELEAIPGQFNAFSKWTVGGVDDFTNPLSLFLDTNKTVVAYFETQNVFILEKYVAGAWTTLATLSHETTTYKDTSGFAIDTAYDYRLLKIENGISITPPVLTGALILTDAPASILLDWGGGA